MRTLEVVLKLCRSILAAPNGVVDSVPGSVSGRANLRSVVSISTSFGLASFGIGDSPGAKFVNKTAPISFGLAPFGIGESPGTKFVNKAVSISF